MIVIYITEFDKIDIVKNYILNVIGINKIAFVVKYISEIPKNLYGKVNYGNL